MERQNVHILVAPEFYEPAIARTDKSMVQVVKSAFSMARQARNGHYIGAGGSFMGSPYVIQVHRGWPTDDDLTLLITDRLFFGTNEELNRALNEARPLDAV